MPEGLLEPATNRGADRGALVCLWPERVLFVGPLGLAAPHTHAAAVCLVALEGELRIQIPPAPDWWCGGAALIPAGCRHGLDLRNQLTAVLYDEPDKPYYKRLRTRELRSPALGFSSGEVLRDAFIDFYEATRAGTPGAWTPLERALSEALEVYPQVPRLDRRIRQTIRRVEEHLSDNLPLSALADAVALSPSRLQHLFLEETGVPLRRFRNWRRFRSGLEHLAAGATLTQAAIDTGFASSSHFSHAFKAMFGVSPARVLLGRPQTSILVADQS